MSRPDYARLAKRWIPIALVLSIAAGALTFYLSKTILPKAYTASATMEVQLGLGSGIAPTDPQFNAVYAETEAQVAGEKLLAVDAVRQAETHLRVHLSAGEFDGVVSSLGCHANGLTAIFSCSFTARSPLMAAASANALADVFQQREKAWTDSRYQALISHLQQQEKSAQQTIVQLQSELQTASFSHDTAQTGPLSAQLQAAQSRDSGLVQLEAQARQAAASVAAIVRVTQLAQVPTSPSSPHPTLNALLAIFLVFGLTIASAVGIYALDDSVRGEDELKELTGLPILGVIPFVSSLKGHSRMPEMLLSVHYPHSTAAEMFRVARANFAFSRLDAPLRSLLVSSALQDEGKSTVAANLAAVFAESGKRTILVDLDLRRPSVSKVFQTPDRGLTNLIVDDAPDVKEFLVSTSIPNLRVLPAGPIPPNPAELLSSTRMGHVMRRLIELADLVIVDSPPILAVADAVIASGLCDAAVLVTRPDRLERRAVKRAMDVARGAGMPLVGLIVNGQAGNDATYYYSSSAYNDDTRSVGARSSIEPEVAVAKREETARPDLAPETNGSVPSPIKNGHADPSVGAMLLQSAIDHTLNDMKGESPMEPSDSDRQPYTNARSAEEPSFHSRDDALRSASADPRTMVAEAQVDTQGGRRSETAWESESLARQFASAAQAVTRRLDELESERARLLTRLTDAERESASVRQSRLALEELSNGGPTVEELTKVADSVERLAQNPNALDNLIKVSSHADALQAVITHYMRLKSLMHPAHAQRSPSLPPGERFDPGRPPEISRI